MMTDSQFNSIRDAIRNVGGEYTTEFESHLNLLKELNGTLFVSNIILGVIAMVLIIHTIIYIKSK